ncbi:hypothetical protein EVAR_12364_1 [Eumeta japonica]|uniref:Uncharacterized protein n=1 Tax=Eumeta variegata TaxID=151549 RepID=A0A4C1X345_EUMVA|nr:hypothetical protein EVAR_12364_1 [Eumeta japonica]
MEKQTTTLRNSIIEEMDEKLKPLVEENLYLKNKMEKLNEKIKHLESGKRENNWIFYGFEEHTKYKTNIIEMIIKTLNDSDIEINMRVINKAFRIGKANGKARPILVKILNVRKRNEILKNKSRLLKNIFVNEDFNKEVLEKRRELIPQLLEEKKETYSILKI